MLIFTVVALLPCTRILIPSSFFFFNDTATTEIYTLSLHDALPISSPRHQRNGSRRERRNRSLARIRRRPGSADFDLDQKSTRLNSSHGYISYAVFCLKKKKKKKTTTQTG